MTRLIRDWLTEYKSLSETDTKTYASTIFSNQPLILNLYDLFHSEPDSNVVVEPVVHQLFEFYRSPHIELRRFTLQYVPTLLSLYLVACSRNEKKTVNSIETTLLGIYNLEVVNDDGSPKIETYRIPSLGMASIYHEATGFLPGSTLTESALSSLDSELRKIQYGPFPQVERVIAKNRLSVMTYVLRCYNADIANFPQMSHQSVCELANRVCATGFDHLKSQQSGKTKAVHTVPRVAVNSPFLLELLSSVYFVMFNGYANAGIGALEDIHFRACHELYPEVLLVTNAIKNSLSQNPSGRPKDGPMGISLAAPTNQSAALLSTNKQAITNASFRIKKLPDDITVGEGEGGVPCEETAEKKTEEKSKAIEQITRPFKSVLKMGDKLRKDKQDGGKEARRDSSGVPPLSPRKQSLTELEVTPTVTVLPKRVGDPVIELQKISEHQIESDSPMRGSPESMMIDSSSSRNSDVMYTCSESSLPPPQKIKKRVSMERVNPHSINTQV